ncbi:hypothetical protein Purlil1_14234 [Purpureocillium lilacinum]|uniref:Uncharacterized protein n=1 Tax=Purpureocillium lilacinum TaxID=33203 RepID=A0ABR0BBZ0_PURLI|nr:hypothetical protein Purlil1_14234 [Purpureocillium lilacinum]
MDNYTRFPRSCEALGIERPYDLFDLSEIFLATLNMLTRRFVDRTPMLNVRDGFGPAYLASAADHPYIAFVHQNAALDTEWEQRRKPNVHVWRFIQHKHSRAAHLVDCVCAGVNLVTAVTANTAHLVYTLFASLAIRHLIRFIQQIQNFDLYRPPSSSIARFVGGITCPVLVFTHANGSFRCRRS